MKVPTFALRAIAKGRAKMPWILAANGVVLTVKACYDFYKAAPKCKQVLEEYRQWEAEIKEAKEKAKTEAVTANYTEKDAKREHAANMLKTAIGFAKIFAPGVVDLMGAFGSFGYSMKILNGRYVAVAARSAQQSRYIDHIEKGIVAAYGADALHKIQHGDPEAPQVIDNDGEPVKKEDAPLPPRKPEQILFTQGNPNFEDTPFKNHTFVTGIQNRLNDVLVHRMKIAQVNHPGKPGITESGCLNSKQHKTFTTETYYQKKESIGTIYDKAGNSTKCDERTIKLDKIAPTCTKTSQQQVNGRITNSNYKGTWINKGEIIVTGTLVCYFVTVMILSFAPSLIKTEQNLCIFPVFLSYQHTIFKFVKLNTCIIKN